MSQKAPDTFRKVSPENQKHECCDSYYGCNAYEAYELTTLQSATNKYLLQWLTWFDLHTPTRSTR